MDESAVRDVGVEPGDRVGETPSRRRRHQELEVRRFDLFVDWNVEGHESFPALDGAASDVDISVPGTYSC